MASRWHLLLPLGLWMHSELPVNMPFMLTAPTAPSSAISDGVQPVQPSPPSSSSGSSSKEASAGPATAMDEAPLSSLAPSTADAPPSAAPVPPGKYVPSPVEPGWEIYVGFLAGIIPFAIGSWEFGKRIVGACTVAYVSEHVGWMWTCTHVKGTQGMASLEAAGVYRHSANRHGTSAVQMLVDVLGEELLGVMLLRGKMVRPLLGRTLSRKKGTCQPAEQDCGQGESWW